MLDLTKVKSAIIEGYQPKKLQMDQAKQNAKKQMNSSKLLSNLDEQIQLTSEYNEFINSCHNMSSSEISDYTYDYIKGLETQETDQ